MKNIFLVLIIFIGASSFVSGDKTKVQFKKDKIYVDKIEWGNYEKLKSKKFIISTLSGVEYFSIRTVGYGTGEYSSQGVEIEEHYNELNFFTTDLGMFEMDLDKKKIISLLIKNLVIVDDKFDQEKAELFQKKYNENISEQRFLTK